MVDLVEWSELLLSRSYRGVACGLTTVLQRTEQRLSVRYKEYYPPLNTNVRPRPDLVGRSCSLVAAVPSPRASSRCTTVEIGRWAQSFDVVVDRPFSQSTRTVTVI